MKIFLALKQIEFVLKMFAAAGFANFAAAFEAKDENALKAHIDGIKSIEKIVEKVVEPTDAQLLELLTVELRDHIGAAGFTLKADESPFVALKAGLTAHQALSTQLSNLNSALATAGIVAADKTLGITAADITKVIENRVALKVAEANGRLGTPPVDPKLNNNPAAAPKVDKTELKGLARVQASFEAEAAQAKSRRN